MLSPALRQILRKPWCLLVPFGLLALSPSTAHAQLTATAILQFPMTGTLSPNGSIPGGLTPSTVLCMDADDNVSPVFPASAFTPPGALSGAWVSSLTTRRDHIPPDLDDLTTQNRWVLIEYTVAPGATGVLGNPVHLESQGNGASSDVFGYYQDGSSVVGPFQISDHWGIDANSDICGLTWRRHQGDISYLFTLDIPQGSAVISLNGAMETVNCSTIFETDGTTINIPAAYQQVFHENDRIRSLACDQFTGQIVFSLAANSPSLAVAAAQPADLLSFILPGQPSGSHPSGSLFLWGEHEKFGLDDGDLLNGLRIGDPLDPQAALGTYLVSPSYSGPPILYPGDSSKYASLTVSVGGAPPSDGGVLRRISMGLATPMTISVLPPGPWASSDQDYILYAFPGIPGTPDAVAYSELVAVADPVIYPGALTLASSLSGVGLTATGPGPGVDLPVPGSIFPSVFTYQAVYFTGGLLDTTNAITVSVE